MTEPPTYRERRSGALAATVWSSTSDGSPVWVLPDGCLDVIWDGVRLRVAGPDTVAEAVEAPPGTSHVAARFDPGVGPAVLGVAASALRDQEVPLADLLPAHEVDALASALHAAGRHPVADGVDGAPVGGEVARVLERWAARRLSSGGVLDPALQHATVLLGRGRRVAEVADELGLGERQLHRRALVAYGYGPKVLARILRFRRAMARAHDGCPLALVAAEAGYSDQAHLAHEARALGGRPLSALLGAP